MSIVRALDDAGVDLFTCAERWDTRTYTGRLTLNIAIAMVDSLSSQRRDEVR